MNFGELIMSTVMPDFEGGDGPGDEENPMAKEMRILYKKKFKYDDKPAIEVVRSVAQKTGADAGLLFSSSFQEGMNKAIAKPDETEQYLQKQGFYNKDFPVSGYDFYGLDTFGGRADEFIAKGYLPPEFKSRYVTVQIENDHMKKDPTTGKMIPDPQLVTSADFRTNEDALMAKAAFLRAESDAVKDYAKQKGLELDNDSLNYFTLASYNAGFGNAKAMLDEYSETEDKKKYLKEGSKKRASIHKNISPRIQNITVANELLNEQP